jgi:hypothetical protein
MYELQLRFVAAIETDTLKMRNTWRETEYRLDTLRATTGAQVGVVQNSAGNATF